MIARLILATFLVSAICCLSPRSAQAQAWPEWQLVSGDLPGSPTAIYFFDATHGSVAIGGQMYCLSYPIVRWQRETLPAGVSLVRSIRNIQGKLYAATNADVIISTDSGHTWRLSGLGLNNANDVYADAGGNIRVLTDPMKVFARIDPLHCIAQGNANIFVSNDGGLTWVSSGVPMVDSYSTGAFADPCFQVYLCPNSWGTVFRSTDLGQSWQTVVCGSGPGSEFLAGTSVTSYVIADAGMVRSTNDGATWTHVITGNPIAPVFVFGPMGEHVIGHNKKVSMIMTNTGGLDDLHSGVDMTDSNGAPLAQNDTFNIPLQLTSHCNALTIGLPFYSQVDSMYETVSILKDSLGDFALTGPTTLLCRRGHEDDTLHLAYNPHHLVSKVTLKIDNHWHCSNWSETRTVMVTALPSAELLPPPPLAGNCKIVREAAYLKLDSCQAMIVDSVLIPERLAARLKFEHPLPDTVLRGAGDSLYFTWDPRDTLTTIFDSVQVFAHYDGVDSALWWWDWRAYLSNDPPPFPPLSQFNRTLPITMYALPNVALITSDSAIQFRALKPCERVQDTLITVKNAGCTSDTILIVNLRGPGFTMDPVTTPIFVRPDSSVTFRVQFIAPTDSVDKHGAIDLWVISGESKTVTIPLTGNGFTTSALFTMSSKSLDADSISFCKGFVLLRDTIRNLGCDTIFFGNITPTADTSFRISEPLPQFIASGDSTILTIRYSTTIKGEHRDTVAFQYALGRTPMRDTFASVTGFVYSGESYLSASLEGVDFPQLYACQTMDTTIDIINIGCDTLYFDSVSFDETSFTSPTKLPLIIPPQSSLPLVVRVSPDTNGGRVTIISRMTMYSEASIIPVQSIPLTVRVAYPENLTLQLTGGPAKGHAGDPIEYDLVLGGAPKQTKAINFAITNSDDLLDSTSFAGNTIVFDSSTRAQNGDVTRYFTLTVPAASDTLAIFRYTVKLADSGSTNVSLSNLSAQPVGGLPGACVTSLSSRGMTFTYDPHCGEDILGKFMGTGKFFIESIHPNPARSEIEIRSNLPQSLNDAVSVHAFDLLGREVTLAPLPSSDGMRYDVSSLAEGVYYLSISIGDQRATQQMVIQR